LKLSYKYVCFNKRDEKKNEIFLYKNNIVTQHRDKIIQVVNLRSVSTIFKEGEFLRL